MKNRPLLLAASAVVLAAASRAYDGTGGVRIGVLLSRVEFARGGDPEFDPPLFEWTESKRREVKDALAAVLTRMPLDVADLPELKRLSVTNARCSAPPDPDRLREDPDFRSGAPETRKSHYLHHCGADTATYYPAEGRIAISGAIYALSRGSSAEGHKLLARVLQHELTHAWEKDPETKPFYALGFERRDTEWFQIINRDAAAVEEEEDRADRADQSRRAAAQKRLAELRASIHRSEEALFLTLGLPLRFGGPTGRIDPRAEAGENPVDTYSMRTRHEYLAVLSELLWVDPPLALRQYSPEEVAWVERHVFKGRPVVVFSPDSATR